MTHVSSSSFPDPEINKKKKEKNEDRLLSETSHRADTDAETILNRSAERAESYVKQLVKEIGRGTVRGGAAAVGNRVVSWLIQLLNDDNGL